MREDCLVISSLLCRLRTNIRKRHTRHSYTRHGCGVSVCVRVCMCVRKNARNYTYEARPSLAGMSFADCRPHTINDAHTRRDTQPLQTHRERGAVCRGTQPARPVWMDSIHHIHGSWLAWLHNTDRQTERQRGGRRGREARIETTRRPGSNISLVRNR